MGQRKSIEQEINDFLDEWDYNEMLSFFRNIFPLFELYNVEDKDDWVEKCVGGDKENVRTIRLIRTVYLISRICEFHAGKMCATNVHFKNLWKRMEREGRGQRESEENMIKSLDGMT